MKNRGSPTAQTSDGLEYFRVTKEKKINEVKANVIYNDFLINLKDPI